MSEDVDQRVGLGRAIELRRVQMGLKRKDLAARSQLSYPYVSELEKGAKEPSAKALRQLADALQLGVADLMALGEQYGSADSTQIELPPFDPSRTAIVIPDVPDSGGKGTPQPGLRTAIGSATRALTETEIEAIVQRVVNDALNKFETDVLPTLIERLVVETLDNRPLLGDI